MTKEQLIDFLEWMNETAEHNPMMLETDNEDIAQMYLSSIQQISKEPCAHPYYAVLEKEKGCSKCLLCGEFVIS